LHLPTLHTERLVIRQLEPADIPAMFVIFSDEAVMRYWSTEAMRESEQAAELLAEIDRYRESGTLFQWGIALRQSNRVIGTCTLNGLGTPHKMASIGYALGQSHWRQGYVREAVEALLAHAFGPMDLHRVEADVDPRNEPSIRVVEYFGFRLEGLQRERYHIGGEIQDAALYGLLRSESRWRQPDQITEADSA
jgi:[ribosomal protein S5]-alanine N-acetyltransferase